MKIRKNLISYYRIKFIQLIILVTLKGKRRCFYLINDRLEEI